MTGAGNLIDLTGDHSEAPLRVAMVTRFPPSCSGAAQAASDLAETLVSRFGIDVEVIRFVPPGEHAAPGLPVVMELNPSWSLGGEAAAAAARASHCDVVLVRLEHSSPVELVDELIDRSEVPVVLVLDDVAPAGTDLAGSVAALAKRADAVVVPSRTAQERIREQTSGSVRADVIPHGSPWSAMEPPKGIRCRILTWGFMSPGMGVERVIQALALLGDIKPAPHANRRRYGGDFAQHSLVLRSNAPPLEIRRQSPLCLDHVRHPRRRVQQASDRLGQRLGAPIRGDYHGTQFAKLDGMGERGGDGGLRRLIYCGEWIESHALHVYFLHAPDFLGYSSAIDMAT